MKALTVNPFDNKKQIFTFHLYSGFFSDFTFNGLRKDFLAILTAARQNIPFLFAIIQLYCKQFPILNDNRFCGSAYFS